MKFPRRLRNFHGDLKLDRLYVLYPGEKSYALTKKIEVIPLAKFGNAK